VRTHSQKAAPAALSKDEGSVLDLLFHLLPSVGGVAVREGGYCGRSHCLSQRHDLNQSDS